jgi:GT2 family glycosyltransferase
MIPITIAICSKDRESQLTRCLFRLKKEKKYFDRLLLVEDISDQQLFTVSKLKKIFGNSENITLRYIPVRYANIAQSRQKALDLTPKGVLIFIDDDVLLSKGSVQKVKNFFIKNSRTSLVTGRVLPKYPQNIISAIDYVYFTQELISAYKQTQITSCPFSFVGINLSVIKKRNQSSFFFDPRFRIGEDIDFTLQLSQANFPIIFEPTIVNTHEYDTSSIQFLRKKFLHGQYMYLLYQKHGEPYLSKSSIPQSNNLLFLLFFFITRPFTLTNYYTTLYPFSIPQRIIIYFGEVVTLLGMRKEMIASQP